MPKFRFFVVIPPGFENICYRELLHLLPSLESHQVSPPEDWELFPGGIEIEAELNFGLSLNYHLKSATRVLMRLGTFPCSDFEELSHIFAQIDWGQYGIKDQLKFNISSRSSRLNHQREIEKFCLKHFKKMKKRPGAMRLDLRFFRDELSLSIDSTGEPLHKRGWRQYTPKAPIRENLASGLLLFLTDGMNSSDDSKYALCDPFMGSGSFLFEGALLNQPQTLRTFSFETWPIAGKVDAYQTSLAWPSFKSFFGCEKDGETYKLLSKNFDSEVFNAEVFDFYHGDNKGADLKEYKGQCYVVSNLPYGARLNRDSRLRPEKVLSQIIDQYDPVRVGLLWSKKHQAPIRQLPRGWMTLNSLHFENGGIPVRFDVFARENILTDLVAPRV